MDKINVRGGRVLKGEVSVSGSKNAALPIIFSSLLAEGEHVFNNVPDLLDIKSTCNLLKSLGCETYFSNNTLKVKVSEPQEKFADYELVRKMRASVLCLGPLLARYGQAKVSLPGGCAIGTRPVDMHIEAMKALGAEVIIDQGYILASCPKLKGETILFENPTVGGTENLLMAATLAEGKTIIENGAKEPEVVDLANYLVKMGAKISGIGTGVIEVEGVEKLHPSQHSIIPDRIEAGTLLVAGAITGGDVLVKNCIPKDFEPLIQKMKEAGFKFEISKDSIRVLPLKSWKSVDITTAPHPAFPTDLQAQYMVLMTQAEGTSLITEGVFENRFMHVQELMRMNASITPKSRVAAVRGVPGKLKGAQVMATDLRASASLILAGLVAEGITTVGRIYHLDRGYEKLEEKLASLGADIERVRG